MDMRINGIFVTGTDTGVGKTVVSAALVSLLRKGGIDAVPMKPVQTGCVRDGNIRLAPDLEFCLWMNDLAVSEQEKRLMAPYCFEKPCSPHLAAAQANCRIEMDRILNALRALEQDHELVVVEGAGGVLVPVDEKNTMLDLMVAMAIPVVLVSRSGLGTINHSLLSLRELRRAGLAVLGVVVSNSESAGWGEIERDNIRTIERLGHVRILGCLPFVAGLNGESRRREDFREKCAAELPPAADWMRWIEDARSKEERLITAVDDWQRRMSDDPAV